MSEMTNNPNDKVRELQRQLWICAKRRRARRFQARDDWLCGRDALRGGCERGQEDRRSTREEDVTSDRSEENDGEGQGGDFGAEGMEAEAPMAEGRRDGRRDDPRDLSGNPARGSDIALVGQHLPARTGSDLGREASVLGGARAVCG